MKVSSRHLARQRALQALYSWQVSQNDIQQVAKFYLHEQEMERVDIPYFQHLIMGVSANSQRLDERMSIYLSRPLNRLSPIEYAILRIAMFELLECPEIPPKVVLNEAIELAKVFGAIQSYKFVNGVLDKALPEITAKRTAVATNE